MISPSCYDWTADRMLERPAPELLPLDLILASQQKASLHGVLAVFDKRPNA
jgi:hypothetical protein